MDDPVFEPVRGAARTPRAAVDASQIWLAGRRRRARRIAITVGAFCILPIVALAAFQASFERETRIDLAPAERRSDDPTTVPSDAPTEAATPVTANGDVIVAVGREIRRLSPDGEQVLARVDDVIETRPVIASGRLFAVVGRSGDPKSLEMWDLDEVTDSPGEVAGTVVSSHASDVFASPDGTRIAYTQHEASRQANVETSRGVVMMARTLDVTHQSPIYQGFAAVHGWGGDDMVLLSSGDAVSHGVDVWDLRTDTTKKMSNELGFSRVLTAHADTGRAVMKQGDGSCWTLIDLDDPKPTSESNSSCELQPGDFSPDGARFSTYQPTDENWGAGTRPVTVVDSADIQRTVAAFPISYVSDILWSGSDTLLVLARNDDEQVLRRCSVKTGRCDELFRTVVPIRPDRSGRTDCCAETLVFIVGVYDAASRQTAGEPSCRETGPRLVLDPPEGPPGTRVRFTGTCFVGPYADERQVLGAYGIFFIGFIEAGDPRPGAPPEACELIGGGTAKLRIRHGEATGSLTVPERGHCFQEKYGAPFLPGTYDIGVMCHACFGETTFRVTAP